MNTDSLISQDLIESQTQKVIEHICYMGELHDGWQYIIDHIKYLESSLTATRAELEAKDAELGPLRKMKESMSKKHLNYWD